MTGKSQEAHLAIVTNTETGLFHGALFVNHPTPSGCDRYLLSRTTTEGYATQRSAAMAINNACPHVEPIDLNDLPLEQDQDIEKLIAMLPDGAFITLITPKKEYGEPAYVQVRPCDNVNAELIKTHTHLGEINKLEALKIIAFDSSSGNDPNLAARYDHYVVIPKENQAMDAA